jgi:hypothetical protein
MLNNKKKKTIKKTVKLQSEKDAYLYYEPSLPGPKWNTEQFVRFLSSCFLSTGITLLYGN